MRHDLSIPEAVADPLIGQLRRADGISDQAFAKLLLAAADAYRASAILKIHHRRADVFYRTIGAGSLEAPVRSRVPEWSVQGAISEW
ncbi:hypothetical protein ACFFP0_09250 [Rhizobium puerariae]|uniref:Uncharacterized protein n=1 Tax=Rhizobium puerariae TaxID=1585791 RepID=A0ABV6AEI7_9HYPH